MACKIGTVMGLLLSRIVHQVINPIVLEMILIRIETFRLGDDFNLLVIVRSASVCSNNSPFKVGMHEVRTTIVFDSLLLLLLCTLLTLGNRCIVKLL